MDPGGPDAKICNGTKASAAMDAKDEGIVNGEEDEKHRETETETESLLASSVKGGLAVKRQKSLKRKVQWNDRNGNRLVEVLEFEPSDSSDSENDSSSNISSTEKVINRLRSCCCLGSQVSHS